MSEPLFLVEKTGLLTSFQDMGRKNHLSKGVVASGAMDGISCQIANLLVGNRKEEACMEIAMQGPSLIVLAEKVLVSICGADLSPSLNGKALDCWKPLTLKRGDKLSFGAPKAGVFSYLAVHGGYSLPSVLGSKSYYGKAGLGMPIEKGATIHSVKQPFNKVDGLGVRSPYAYKKDASIRVILGPHHGHFSKQAVASFLNQPYKVGQADRMGYRLLREDRLSLEDAPAIDSDAIPFGGIQIPEDGFPIVLLADRQTTGGYRRMATVITADLPKLVQVPPGGTIRFQAVSLEDAYTALRKQQSMLKTLSLLLANAKGPICH